MFSCSNTAIVISILLSLSLHQVQSRLRNAQPLDGDDINLLAMELLEMKAYRPQNGYGGMCTTNFECSFNLYPGAFMQCCTSGTDLNTCHFFCNSMVHTLPKSATPQVASGGNGNSVNTASNPRSHTRHGVHDIGTLLASGQNGQNNNPGGVIVATVGQNNAANGVTLKEIGQNNAVNGNTLEEVGQNNAVNGITIATIGQNNAVNGNTFEEIGQDNNVNGVAIATVGQNNAANGIILKKIGQNNAVNCHTINSVSEESFSMNYYYLSPRLPESADLVEDPPIEIGLLPVGDAPDDGDFQIIALSN